MSLLRVVWANSLALVLCVCAACASSQTPPPAKVARASTAGPSTSTPPPLSLETFQAAWEIIRDTHFDTNYNGLNWNAVRTQFLPRIEQSKSSDEVRDVIQEMLDLLGHSHLMILEGSPHRRTIAIETNRPAITSPSQPPLQPPPSNEMGGIGIEVRPLENQIVIFRVEPNSPAAEKGLKPGWIIQRIDDEPAIDPTISTNISERERTFLLWHNAATLLKGPVSEKCVLELKIDSGESKTISIPRAREGGMPAKLGNLPTMFMRVETNQLVTAGSQKRIGYLRFNLWMIPGIPTIDRFIDANRNAEAIIIDLRGNLGGIGGMVMGVAGHFINERASLGVMKMRENELNFVANPRRVNQQSQPTNTFQGKLAILVDPVSLSTSELFAGGMQELGRARVFGQPTGGQALPAISERLPNGDILYHAVADFTTPKGKRLEKNGVIPDEIIPLRVDSLRAGRDETLEAALRWINPGGQPDYKQTR